MTPVFITPLAYDPSFEKTEEGEAETISQINDTMAKIRETTYKDTGHAYRSVHTKSHGLLKGELKVLDGLPEHLAQGMFATAEAYPLLMRLSTAFGDITPDNVSGPRGCAIKVIGVPGERLEDGRGQTTQDFLMVNAIPYFLNSSLKSFMTNIKPIVYVTDKSIPLKQVISGALQGIEKGLEAVGTSSPLLRVSGGEPEKEVLGETFFSQAPILYGKYMAKISMAPVSDTLMALKDVDLDTKDRPDALRESIIRYFADNDGVWELRVQLCTDSESMPLEDLTVEWPQDVSPYVAVAQITIPRQVGWSEARSAVMDDKISFNPWHCLAAHRPLGSIMRGRRIAYRHSADFRGAKYGLIEEPVSTDFCQIKLGHRKHGDF